MRASGSVLDGIDAIGVTLEARVSASLRTQELRLVGLAETSVKEGVHRARSAVWGRVKAVAQAMEGGILINLAPADLRKTGRGLDLPLAVVYAALLLGLEEEGPRDRGSLMFLGELSLAGAVQPIAGILPHVLGARRRGARGVVLPAHNLAEARLVEEIPLFPVETVDEALAVRAGKVEPDQGARGRRLASGGAAGPDLAQVRGQHHARRALEIAAAGEHNLLLEGPPGSGKTMLARRLPGILPDLNESDALEVAGIRSLVRAVRPEALFVPPFRAPHHTATAAGLVGGGSPLVPGELSLAHRGVLFLDELPEFDRRALEVLREPLEEREIHLTRAGRARSFPADFLCVAAMNPCPCGFFGVDSVRCRCTPRQVRAYRGRLSGPLLDRFDMRLVLPPVAPEALFDGVDGESSDAVRLRVFGAREAQLRRQGKSNGRLSDRGLEEHAALASGEKQLLRSRLRKGGLSARAIKRVQRVARTVADLGQSPTIEAPHLLEALSLRVLDDADPSPAAAS